MKVCRVLKLLVYYTQIQSGIFSTQCGFAANFTVLIIIKTTAVLLWEEGHLFVQRQTWCYLHYTYVLYQAPESYRLF